MKLEEISTSTWVYGPKSCSVNKNTDSKVDAHCSFKDRLLLLIKHRKLEHSQWLLYGRIAKKWGVN